MEAALLSAMSYWIGWFRVDDKDSKMSFEHFHRRNPERLQLFYRLGSEANHILSQTSITFQVDFNKRDMYVSSSFFTFIYVSNFIVGC